MLLHNEQITQNFLEVLRTPLKRGRGTHFNQVGHLEETYHVRLIDWWHALICTFNYLVVRS